MTADTPARQPKINDCIHFDYCKLEQRKQGFCDTNFYCTHYHKPKDCATHTSPPAPDEPDWMKGYPPEMRAWAEACNIGAEEQYIREQREDAAKAAREQVLDEILSMTIGDQHEYLMREAEKRVRARQEQP